MRQVCAVLLFCKSLLVFIESPELVYEQIEQTKALRAGKDSDFILLKYLVRTMIGYNLPNEISVYEPQRLCQRISELRVLEQELRTKHAYAKYLPHLDYLEVLERKELIPVADFEKMVRPYLMSSRQCDARWEYRFR